MDYIGKKEKQSPKEFYTVRGYALLKHAHRAMTASMEDYLEMLYRLAGDDGYTRITDLATALNVQPPSASKMVQKLADGNYVNYKKYGVLELTERGKDLGNYLLKRHQTVERFLTIIGVEQNLLAETEQIEHNLSPATVHKIMIFVEFLNHNQMCLEAFKTYKQASLQEPI